MPRKPIKRYRLVVVLPRHLFTLIKGDLTMVKEKQITLGEYTAQKLRKLTKCERGELELLFGYRLDEKRIERIQKTGMPKIPVFGLASQHTPADMLEDGFTPSNELIEYWEATNEPNS